MLFRSEELFKKLQVRSQKQDLRIKTITGQQSNYESMSTDLTVKSLNGKGMITIDKVRSIPSLQLKKNAQQRKPTHQDSITSKASH